MDFEKIDTDDLEIAISVFCGQVGIKNNTPEYDNVYLLLRLYFEDAEFRKDVTHVVSKLARIKGKD